MVKLSDVYTNSNLVTRGMYNGKGIQYVYKVQLNTRGIYKKLSNMCEFYVEVI